METTTPMPVTTSTSRGPDIHEYERSFTQGRITDAEIETLKNCIRVNYGLPVEDAPDRKAVPKASLLPQIVPKSNETSRMRSRMHAYRLLRLCGALIDGVSPDEAKMLDEKEPLSDELKTKLLKAREWTPEQLEEAFEKAEFERLRRTAMSVREAGPFKENNCSAYRYQRIRHEPIVTEYFRRTYSNHTKPPFELSWRYSAPTAKSLPPINKKKEIWLIPVEDDDGTPLQTQSKSSEKDTKSRRERARPPLKKYKKPPRKEIKPESLRKKRTRKEREPLRTRMTSTTSTPTKPELEKTPEAKAADSAKTSGPKK